MRSEEIFLTIKYMKQKKYFKTYREYEKAKHFVHERNIPKWLSDDIKKYTKLRKEG